MKIMADALARTEKGGALSQRLRLQTAPPGARMWAVGWAGSLGGEGGCADPAQPDEWHTGCLTKDRAPSAPPCHRRGAETEESLDGTCLGFLGEALGSTGRERGP